MNIIEACKLGKKFDGEEVKKAGDKYWVYSEGGLVSDEGYYRDINKDRLFADYELYEEGIRPKINEVWIKGSKIYLTIKASNEELAFIDNIDARLLYVDNFNPKPTHNQNGWQRIHPPVEDERVDIEGLQILYKDGFVILCKGERPVQIGSPLANRLVGKPITIFLTNKGEG